MTIFNTLLIIGVIGGLIAAVIYFHALTTRSDKNTIALTRVVNALESRIEVLSTANMQLQERLTVIDQILTSNDTTEAQLIKAQRATQARMARIVNGELK